MTTTTLAYRDSLEGARLRYTEPLSRAHEGSALSGTVRVSASRTGRIWAGATGIAGAALMALNAAVTVRQPYLVDFSPSTVLALSWPAMGLAYAAGRIVGGRRMRGATTPPETGDLHADLARMEKALPVAGARRLATSMERMSVALPMMAVALLAPLSIHSVFCLLTGIERDLDKWIQMSLVIVGHAHVALAYMYWKFARDASRMESDELVRRRSSMEWSAWGAALLVSAIPGVVLFLIPPLLTAVTGLVFHPLLFRTMTQSIVVEREALS